MKDVTNKRPLPDFWTVISIALIVYAMSSFIHEGLGHGGACLLTGGKPLLLTTVSFDCSSETRWVAAGGTIANLIAGLIFLYAGRKTTRSPQLRYFFWLAMTINLLAAGGYFLYSGIGNIGDWAQIIHGLQPAWLWHAVLAVIGALSYYAVIVISLNELRPVLPADMADRVTIGRKLMVMPYLFGGLLSCLAGALNPIGMVLVAISAAAASFGGASALAWMWQLLRKERGSQRLLPQLAIMERSKAWITAAVLVSAVFIAVLGRGIRFTR